MIPNFKPVENSLEQAPLTTFVERGEKAFPALFDFTKRLRDENIEAEIPNEETVNRVNPKNKTEDVSGNVIAYGVAVGGKTVGIIFGKEQGDLLEGDWYIIDPQYQNTEVKEKLLEIVSKDFKRITLLAARQGEVTVPKDVPDYMDALIKKKSSRQQALVRYYEKLGFKRDTSSEFNNSPHRQLYDPVEMVWELNSHPDSE